VWAIELAGSAGRCCGKQHVDITQRELRVSLRHREIILASQSPRRLALLEQLGFRVQVRVSGIDEKPLPNESVDTRVVRLASAKAMAVASDNDLIPIVAADTLIVLEGEPIGKPASLTQAASILASLSGKSHDVFTGTAIVCEGALFHCVVKTEVTFKALTKKEIRAYCQSGEPMGKAGAYAIQGLGATLVKSIHGSYSNVVGLPLFETAELLQKAGAPVLAE
jgi:septum formation protein